MQNLIPLPLVFSHNVCKIRFKISTCWFSVLRVRVHLTGGRLRTQPGSTRDQRLASPKCLSVPCNVLAVTPHSQHTITHHSPLALQSFPNASKKKALVNSWLDDELNLKWHSAHRAGLTRITEQKVLSDVRVHTQAHTL